MFIDDVLQNQSKITPNRINRRFNTSVLQWKINIDIIGFKYYEIGSNDRMIIKKLYIIL